jgi:hypothetical protein
MLTREGLAIGKMATFDDQGLQVLPIVQVILPDGLILVALEPN